MRAGRQILAADKSYDLALGAGLDRGQGGLAARQPILLDWALAQSADSTLRYMTSKGKVYIALNYAIVQYESMITSSLEVNGATCQMVDVARVVDTFAPGAYAHLPYSLRVLAENIARAEPDSSVHGAALRAIAHRRHDVDLPFRPHRVLLQDVLGSTALVDLAGLRDAIAERGGDPRRVNPAIPVHMVVDHALNVEHSGHADAIARNMESERRRNAERFAFMAWAGEAFDHVSIIPSGNGILHQVNLERLASVVVSRVVDDVTLAYPDTLLGPDRH